ncbi:MAG: DUF362 domain-containing protein [Coriobacteriales bacterium]|nr:DUF362 domain-containing protein [Coriobacteriales bacterium]
MTDVSIARCADYDPEHVVSALDAALSPLGGMAAFVSPGQSVLVKVNLLSRAEPERAVTTHPEVVRAIVRSVRDVGGMPSVGDSPGGPNTAGGVRRIWRDSGIEAVCREENVPLLLFDDDCVKVPTPDSALYGSFTVGRAVAEADVVISVPKFKTHGLMLFTGAVKNLFGCIPGLEKGQFHAKVPDRDDFGSMLVDLALACRPALAIMDAVVGMEGQGPAGGTPRSIGAVIVSPDAFALDIVAAAMAGLDPYEVYTNKAARSRGLAPERIDEIRVHGEDWRALAPPGFALPDRDVSQLFPAWLTPRLRSWATARPVLASMALCKRCGECARLCPVDAITMTDDGPEFDRERCIRCYCCQELCPPQAIELKVPPLARLLTKRW